ncbi:MAG: hypothetical protein ABSC61_03575 [Anaerolineales bacterium]
MAFLLRRDRTRRAAPGVKDVWRCRTIFQCTLSCPREIKITQAIAEVKGAIVLGKYPKK